MTQFVCVGRASADSLPADLGQVLEQIGDVTCRPGGEDWVWVVSSHDPSSAGPLVDDLYNRVQNKEDIEAAPLVQLLRAVAQRGWHAKFWYSDDSADLPEFETIEEALHDLIRQASLQPPEIYLAFRVPALEHRTG